MSEASETSGTIYASLPKCKPRVQTCSECHGLGLQFQKRDSGLFVAKERCEVCSGYGRVVVH
jgi:DnaJ-class molecular chaperone